MSGDSQPFGPAYRACVGIMVLNTHGQIFVGKRVGSTDAGHVWQMPQGGIDPGETPEQAAWRELREETSITTAEKIGESEDWFRYELPPEALARWNGEYSGQAQKWFVFRYLGADQDIDLNAHEEIEFSDWGWREAAELPILVIPFKRAVYEAVIAEFQTVIGA